VFLIATALVGLSLFPFLWVLLVGLAGSKWQFMGALHDYRNGASELSRVFQGAEGRWLTYFLHTPEPHNRVFIETIYAFLGQISRITLLSPLVIFHVARLAASYIMYLALYQFAASVWTKVRTRRLFFMLAAIGGGFGWVLGPLTGNVTYLDLTAPEAFPFYSSLVNVHFPLAIACLAVMSSVIIMAFRPGGIQEPNLRNGGLVISLLSFILVVIYPLAFVSIMIAFVVCLVWTAYRARRIDVSQARWLMWMMLPALPVLAYYGAILTYNDLVVEIWEQQNSSAPASPLVLILSLGPLVIIALPGIYRAVRRFEPDGDQFLVIWFITIIVLIYLPTLARQRFVLGITIPLVYFGTRSLEDFWLNYVNRRWRWRIMVGAIPLLAASHILVLILPLRSISDGDFSEAEGMLLQEDYFVVFDWLESRTNANDVVLASPTVSLWLPVWTGARVVYGHPTETVEASKKKQAVEDWYAGFTDETDCLQLLQGVFSFRDSYTVKYVLFGPQEMSLGNGDCVNFLTPIGNFGDVQIYLTANALERDDP
jgi:hypothetical protein